MIILIKKTRYLLNFGWVGTAVWMHHMDDSEAYIENLDEKFRRMRFWTNPGSNFHKTTAVRPLNSYRIILSKWNEEDMWGSAEEIRMDSQATLPYRFLRMDASLFTDQQGLTYISSLQTHDTV